MKRYVVEFANECLHNPYMLEKDKEQIKKIVKLCERGLITSFEAVDSIVRVYKS